MAITKVYRGLGFIVVQGCVISFFNDSETQSRNLLHHKSKKMKNYKVLSRHTGFYALKMSQ